MTDDVALTTAAPGDPSSPGPTAASVTKAVPPRCPTRTRLYRSGKLVAEGQMRFAIANAADMLPGQEPG